MPPTSIALATPLSDCNLTYPLGPHRWDHRQHFVRNMLQEIALRKVYQTCKHLQDTSEI